MTRNRRSVSKEGASSPSEHQTFGYMMADFLQANVNATFSASELEMEFRGNDGLEVTNAHLSHFFNKLTVVRHRSIAETLALSGLYVYTGKRRAYNEARNTVALKASHIIRSSEISDWNKHHPFQVLRHEGTIVGVDYDWQEVGPKREIAEPLDVKTDPIELRMKRRHTANATNSQEILFVKNVIRDA